MGVSPVPWTDNVLPMQRAERPFPCNANATGGGLFEEDGADLPACHVGERDDLLVRRRALLAR